MGTNENLLRMLEPAVRPVGAAGPGRASSAGAAPIEARDFDSVLQEARELAKALPDAQAISQWMKEQESKPAPEQTGPHDGLAGLSGMDCIENTSVRKWVGETGKNVNAQTEPQQDAA